MESRKRLGSEASAASSSRPAKRVATDSEPLPIQTDPFAYDDLSFINEFRKEAIYRTLIAERRETTKLKERLKQHESQADFHNDHLKIVDIWLKQLLEELFVSCGQYNPSQDGSFSSSTIMTEFSFQYLPTFSSPARQRSFRSSSLETPSRNYTDRIVSLSAIGVFKSSRLRPTERLKDSIS